MKSHARGSHKLKVKHKALPISNALDTDKDLGLALPKRRTTALDMAAYAPLDIPPSGALPFTDYSRWRLRLSPNGDHTWHYLRTDDEVNAWPQSTYDKYWLGQAVGLPDLPPPTNAVEAARNGYRFFQKLQTERGHWAGEYGGPMFLIPGLVIGSYVCGMGFKTEERLEIIRYLFNHTNEDGGWGM